MLRPGHRADIDALRAVAIVVVVAFHAGVPGTAGGFVGVDVFFVLSGLLITRQLLDEVDGTGTVGLTRFWARRIRRLVPAAAVMTCCVLLAAAVVGSPLAFDAVASAGAASSVYASNLFFGAQAADYFAHDVATNPLLHTWSLAVEEQFYLVWPVLVLVLTRAAVGSRRRFVTGVAVFSIVSFAACWWLTARGTPWAFYLSPVRAWEFGLGALVALVPPIVRTSRRRHGVVVVLSSVAVAGLGFAVWRFDGSTSFPGPWALVPAGATAVLLALRLPALGRIGSWPPVATTGRLSYGWYLWHWPVLVLAAGYFGPLGLGWRVALALSALIPAWLSYRLVEDPVRFSATLSRSVRPNLVLAGAAAGAVLLGVAGGQAWVDRQLEEPDVRPLAAARQDVAGLTSGDCDTLEVPDLVATCRSGGEGQPVLLIGDSNAAQWQPAVETAAEALGLPVVTSWRSNCPAVPVPVRMDGRSSIGCRHRQAAVLDLIDAVDPAAVVLSHSVGYDTDDDQWRAALAGLASALRDRDIPVGMVLSIPNQELDPLDCAAIHGLTAGCTIDRVTAESQVAATHRRDTAALADAGHGAVLDPLPLLCPYDTCPLRVGDVITYRDASHLTSTFAAALAPDIGRWLALDVLGI